MRTRPILARLLVAVALIVFALTATTPVASAATGWKGPNIVFDGRHRQVSMAVDSAGKVHAAASGKDGLWYLTNRTGSWVKTRLTTKPLDGYDGWPSLSLDDDSRVHIVFERQTCLGCVPGGDAALRYLTDSGRPRGTFPSSATFLAYGNRPSLQVVNNKMFLAYATCLCYPEQYENPLYFMTNVTGSWQTTEVWSWGDTPSLKVANDGGVTIAFADEGELYWATTLTDGGRPTYDFLYVDWLGTSKARQPSLALDSRDNPHIAWTTDGTSAEGGGTYYAKWSGTRWVGGRFTTTKWDVDLTLDANNKPHMVVLPPTAGVYYFRRVNGVLKAQTLTSTAVVDSAAVALGSTGKPVVLYTAAGGVQKGVYYAKRL